MIKVGWDKIIEKFTYLELRTVNSSQSIVFGHINSDTRITPIVVDYELVGIYSSALYNPYKGKGELETLQFIFNTCMDEGNVEPDVLDYLMHRYIGVGDTSSINQQLNQDQ